MSCATRVTPMHAHYAIQIAFGSEPGIRFRPSEREEWTEYSGVAIASRQPHTMDATAVPFNAVLFVEPETREGRALAERFRERGITALSSETIAEIASPLFVAWRDERSLQAVKRAAGEMLRTLTGGVEPAIVSDHRILRAVSHINSHLESPLGLEDIAAVACLSPGRFRHLFVEQTGTPLRPYILWRRFLRAFELVAAGEPVSRTAYAAGFADAAHLTRTCRRMFGFPPSAIRGGAPLAK
ncbi:MAG: AraC family transcriptional regulator [Gemmatimonadaceae bacterium]